MSPTLPDPHHPTSEELFAYRDGELTADRRTLIEAHVLACAVCSERLEEMSAAEVELRRRADDVGEEYLERMTRSVMAKIGAERQDAASAVGADGRAAGRAVAQERDRLEGVPLGGGYVDVPRVDRRRPDVPAEDLEPRRRLHLPWIGIGGGAAAAVAVVVVAVLLFHNQSEWIRAPRPSVVGEPRAEAPRADSMLAKENLEGAPAADPSARNQAALQRERGARDKVAAKKSDRAAALESDAKMKAARSVPAPVGLGSAQVAPPKDEALHYGGSGPAATAPVAPEAQGDRKMGVAQEAAPGTASGGPSGEAYTNLLRTFRLPPLWNPSVSGDAVTRAEADLRYLYQTGRAGADSARIRLYLAEAERSRLTDPSNTAAVESISHHYRRAISLAGSDTALAATARRRLQEFEEEMTRARGSQP